MIPVCWPGIIPPVELRLDHCAGRDLRLGWRTVEPDLTSRNGFRWPLPGGVARVEHVDRDVSRDYAEGLHVAWTVRGATAAGYRRTVLLVAVDPDDLVTPLAGGGDKGRASRVWVLGMGDLHWAVGPGADLSDAVLRDAVLSGAVLSGGITDIRAREAAHDEVEQWCANRKAAMNR